MTEFEIFTAALNQADPAARLAYLDHVCGGDPKRRRRIEVLLKAHELAEGLESGEVVLHETADDITRHDLEPEMSAVLTTGDGWRPRLVHGFLVVWDYAVLVIAFVLGAISRLVPQDESYLISAGSFALALGALCVLILKNSPLIQHGMQGTFPFSIKTVKTKHR